MKQCIHKNLFLLAQKIFPIYPKVISVVPVSGAEHNYRQHS